MERTLDPAPLAAWRVETRESYPAFVRELIDEVLADTAAQLAVLEHASTARDTAACKTVAHRLKSSCRAIGAVRLASLFEEMEILAKGGAVAFLGDQFTQIRAEYGRLQPVLQQQQFA